MEDTLELTRACEAGEWKRAAAVIRKSTVSVNARDPQGYTALHYAVSRGHARAAQLLLDNGADVNAVDLQSNRTPLHCACNIGSVELVEMLLGNPECIATINSQTKVTLFRPLHCVAASSVDGCQAIAAHLLKAGALVNARDAEGNTALAFAVKRALNVELVEALLKGSADPNIPNKKQVTALHSAASISNGEFMRLLMQYGGDPNTSVTTLSPMPPLHLAARFGSFEACQQLVTFGARVNQAGSAGRFPIHFAAFGAYPHIVTLLAESGASLDAVDMGNHTALAYAANQGCVESTTLLLALGADPNIATREEKWTPLHHAARGGHAAVAAVLTAHAGTDINSRDSEQRTPLHWAVFTEDLPMVMTLVEHGANALFEDVQGLSPAQVAIEKDLPDIGAVLEGHTGVKRSTLTRTGNSLGSYWITSSASPYCIGCSKKFSRSVKRNCCRPCRGVFCSACLPGRLPQDHPRFPKDKVCSSCLEQYEEEKSLEKIRSLLGSDGSTEGQSFLRQTLRAIRNEAIENQSDGGRGYTSKFNALAPIGIKQQKKASNKNQNKNRYPDILAYDHSRVKLSGNYHKDDPDYINASYIMGNDAKVPMYIASQGPTSDTTHSFWQMIWEQGTTTIVMLTPLVERDIVKCHRYWPEVPAKGGKATEIYGDFTVTTVGERNFKSYIKRVLRVQPTKDIGSCPSRPVLQYSFLAWPDHGAPRSTKEILDMYWAIQPHFKNLPLFLAEDRKSIPKGIPLPVIHCSAGVGRTGTFIALDTIVNSAQATKPIDIMEIIRRMRLCRNYMVQSVQQFVFVFKLAQDVTQELINGSERSIRALTSIATRSRSRKGSTSPTRRINDNMSKNGEIPVISPTEPRRVASPSNESDGKRSGPLSPDDNPGGFKFNPKSPTRKDSGNAATRKLSSSSTPGKKSGRSPTRKQSSGTAVVTVDSDPFGKQFYTTKYVGSQNVTLAKGDVAARSALDKVNKRKTQGREVSLAVSAAGMEIIEKGRNEGALFAATTITDAVALLSNSTKAPAHVAVTIMDSTQRLKCHCFEVESKSDAEAIETHLLTVLTTATSDNVGQHVVSEDQQLVLAMQRSVSESNTLSEEEQLAIAMSESMADANGLNHDEEDHLALALKQSLAGNKFLPAPASLESQRLLGPTQEPSKSTVKQMTEDEMMEAALQLSLKEQNEKAGMARQEKSHKASNKSHRPSKEDLRNNPFAPDELQQALAASLNETQTSSAMEEDEEMQMALALSASLSTNSTELSSDKGTKASGGAGHGRSDSATEVANVWAAASTLVPSTNTSTPVSQDYSGAVTPTFHQLSSVPTSTPTGIITPAIPSKLVEASGVAVSATGDGNTPSPEPMDVQKLQSMLTSLKVASDGTILTQPSGSATSSDTVDVVEHHDQLSTNPFLNKVSNHIGIDVTEQISPSEGHGTALVHPSAGDSILVGDSVHVASKNLDGLCRYVGPVHFASGNWIGIELQHPNGKNDGAVKGQRYFQCPELHGIFARESQVLRVRCNHLSTDSLGSNLDAQAISDIDKGINLLESGGDVELLESGGDMELLESGGDMELLESGGDIELLEPGGDMELLESGGDVDALESYNYNELDPKTYASLNVISKDQHGGPGLVSTIEQDPMKSIEELESAFQSTDGLIYSSGPTSFELHARDDRSDDHKPEGVAFQSVPQSISDEQLLNPALPIDVMHENLLEMADDPVVESQSQSTENAAADSADVADSFDMLRQLREELGLDTSSSN